mmetsp:Transcript_24381/g.44150  ORF Transcript_24381/g.44150 Transcript_24381/m.44150 type:complete len:383 (-) Transcript_24381:133-1281(-)|eukprot:CAMPEP_0197651118 /NCGR_PEP_ID=MMETSP1338-20131121/31359_1 /TAXON_ID=43686 ORGANISM="Pelagodinium beii, Strain RCC1491" /NCGR_SAMPLE_ID=MMETSP1338 /ASSEMBLY_ACC=CAM_ASM_000754 /LENGTH=382 /DNA_ID=CAMNT_0043225673 /DNA_START=72 /DNA_END=1220 /DNA_ORIENTATION=+
MPTSKPTNIDAQRILAIMDELKEKLTFLSVVSPQVMAGLQSEEGGAAVDLMGPELMRSFSEQLRLEDIYVMANNAAEGGFGHNDETEEQREDVKSLQKNTLELCRKMKSVPHIVQELRNYQETRPVAVIQFLKTLADMQELTLKRLTTTVEEEKSRQELLEHYKSRESEASTRRMQLEKDLSHIRREMERAQNHRSEILTKLKADLINVKDSKQEKMASLRSYYETRMKECQEAFDARKDELQKKINALNESNKKLKSTNNDDEMDQKKKAKRYETDVEAVINRYDQEVKALAKTFQEEQDNLKKDQRQLSELREHFEKVEEEKQCIAAEEAVVGARRQKLDNEKKLKSEMAALLQAYWRGIIQREQYGAMKKQAKKGGKKK